MNAIIGFSQLLEFDPALSDEQREYVGLIRQGGEHLLELINDVLDLSKIEAGHIEMALENLSMASVLGQCLDLAKPIAANYGVTLHFPEGDAAGQTVRADRMRLKQCLLNLVSNAIKYNRRGGEVRVECRDLDGQTVRVSVADSGLGIPQERLAEIFEPFNRLRTQSDNVEGTGIGLTITKRLVESMNGSIGVESCEGRGSEFWIDLPSSGDDAAVESASVAEEKTPTDRHESSGALRTILYIEDSPVNLTLVQRIVKKYRSAYRLATAELPKEGIDMAQRLRPDLILLDITLPGMDGYQVLRHLRERDETRGIPVVAVSANAMPEDTAAALKAGFCRYLTKPLSVSEFLAALDDLLV